MKKSLAAVAIVSAGLATACDPADRLLEAVAGVAHRSALQLAAKQIAAEAQPAERPEPLAVSDAVTVPSPVATPPDTPERPAAESMTIAEVPISRDLSSIRRACTKPRTLVVNVDFRRVPSV
ncbi:MAG: hypothetical protein ACRD2J_03510 [Thermoanaerobaculia bacterium]